MPETKTNIRQAKTRANVVGKVSEIDLKKVTEDGKTKIAGSITVKTSDVNFVKFGVNVNEKTNAGAENKTFLGITTVMNEYRSIADVGEDEATIVSVGGELNPFTGRNGEKMVMYKSNFFNRVKSEDWEPRADFEVEMYIASITPEAKDGEETGRILVRGWVPTYNGIEPITLVAEEEVGEEIQSAFEVGQTVEFYGDIVNNRIETVTEIPVKIGKPRKKVSVEYKNDLVITGASEPYEEGASKYPPYEKEVIEAAIQERKNKLEEQKNKANAVQPAARPSGASHGRTLGF